MKKEKMKEWKVTVLLSYTFEKIIFYVEAKSEDEAIQKVLEIHGYKENELIIKDVEEIK